MERYQIFSNLIWRFAERCGAQFVSFIVTIVLARMLTPEIYGTVALINVFTNILQVFVDSGLGNALIQKKDADEIDFSTVFYTNLIFCGIIYALLFLCAPLIAEFYHDSSLIFLIRLLGITLLVSGVKNIQQSYVSKNMLFKKFFFSTLGGTTTAALVGIGMAVLGYGVVALVAQQLVNITIDTVILWITVKWRPRKVFSFSRLKSLFSYGWKLLLSSLLDILYNNSRQLIIGKLYSSSDLAYYNKGKEIPNYIVVNINSSIDSVLLPAMSNVQNNRCDLKNTTRRAIKTSVYIMAPLMIGLICTSDIVIKLILTEKWIGCVPYLRIFCITFVFWPIHTANLNAIKALGRSDLFLKMEIMKKSIGMVLLLGTMWFGPMVMAYSLLLNSVFSQLINSWPNKKLLDYGYAEQLKDVFPAIVLAIGMGMIVNVVPLWGLTTLLTLIIQVLLGMFIYVIGSKIFNIDSYAYLKDICLTFLKNFRTK